MNLSLISPNHDNLCFQIKIEIDQMCKLHLGFQRCGGPERHQMLTVITPTLNVAL